jgi:hypothetical protein
MRIPLQCIRGIKELHAVRLEELATVLQNSATSQARISLNMARIHGLTNQM